METERKLYRSVSLLVGAVIGILAFIRGSLQVWLLLGVFTVWGAWVVFFLLMPYIRRSRKYRLRRRHQQKLFRQGITPDAGNSVSAGSSPDTVTVLMHHVNHRITAYLRSIYPEATWEWCEKSPERLVLAGGTGRVRVYGAKEYDYADINVNKSGVIHCSMVKAVPFSDLGRNSSEEPVPPNKQPIDPQIWYEAKGRKVLEGIIHDLDSRGYSQIALSENGDVQIKQDNENITLDTLAGFPAKVYWPRLQKVFQGDGLSSDIKGNTFLLSW